MSNLEGYTFAAAKIKSVEWPVGKIQINLKDGRSIIAPLKMFPSLKKVSPEKRKKFTILDEEALLFHAAPEVYHISDFLGVNK